MNLKLDWNALKTLKQRPKITSLGVPCELISGDLYRFSECEYASAPHQAKHNDSWDYLVSEFFWAATHECARGFLLNEPALEEIPRLEPPSELLLELGCMRYEDLLRAVSFGQHGHYLAQPISPCASLFEKTFLIAVERLDYYFSSGVENWKGQTPLLIGLRTDDDRWRTIR